MRLVAQLKLVPPLDGRPVFSRRLTDEPPGAHEWYKVLERAGLKGDYSRLSEEDITKVRKGVVEALRTLNRNNYGSFCAEAHGYFNRVEILEYFREQEKKPFDPSYAGIGFDPNFVGCDSPLSDLPYFGSVRKEYEVHFGELRRGQQQARKWEDRGALTAGGLGVIIGAIMGGEVAEYIAQSDAFRNFADYVPALSLATNFERVASAATGLLAGVVSWLGTGSAFQKYGNSLRTQEKKLEERVYDDFAGRVEGYLRRPQ